MITKIINTPIVNEVLKFSPTKVLSILVGIVSFKFYTHIFSANEYGIYNLIISSFSLITVFSTGWIGYVLIRYFEKHKKEDTLNDFLSTITTVLTIVIMALFIVGTPILFIIFDGIILYFFAFLSLPLTMITSLLVTYYQLNQDVKRYNSINILSSIGIFALFYLFFVSSNLRLTGFFLSTVIINLGLLLIAYFDFKGKNLRFHINKAYLIEYLHYGLPQVGTGIGVVLLSVISRYFINYYNGADDVGVFSAAFKFGELSILLPLGIFTSIFAPYVYREFEINGKDKAYASILKYKILYIVIFGPIFILLYIYPKLPMILLGGNFENSLSLIPVICLGNFIFGYAQFLALYSQIDYKPLVVTLAILGTSLVSLLLNFVLIPLYGIAGSAYSMLISYVLYIGFIIVFSKINITSIPLRSFSALIITALTYSYISNSINVSAMDLWLKIIFGASIWIFLFLAIGLFKQFKRSFFFRYL
jgi:O-antigen/teichoic acid export membrane protein